jgi:4-hydroxy-tetrahydrodipicolinate synthase
MFSGSMVPVVTPFKEGEIDWESLERLIEFQIEKGSSGIVPCGTTGESATLSHEEHIKVVEFVVKKVNKRIPVIAGAGSNSTDEAIALAKAAVKAGADGLLIVTPYYNKPTQAGLIAHYTEIAKSVTLPIILYNVPSRTGVNLLPETVAQLAEIENIVGIKEASGVTSQISEIINLCRGNVFSVFSGEDALTFPILCLGGKGSITATANVVPAEFSQLNENVAKGKIAEAAELHYKLLPLCMTMFIETNPAPVKEALYMMKLIESPEVRLPLVGVRESNKEKIKKVLVDIGLI